ncbi:MAG: phosphotransferase [Muribaculaceae bacterium]|nr:phosphotransferase [Muribaculaceae bacterium]
MERLKKLYAQFVGSQPTDCKLMEKSGSNRQYYRLSGVRSIVGVLGELREENDAFIYMAGHFRQKGLPVPEVYAVSDDHMAYIQEDLGGDILYSKIRTSCATQTFTSDEKSLLFSAMRQLCDFQFKGTEDFDYSICYPAAAFDERSIKWDLNYFKYCFLKPTHVGFNEEKLECDFERLTQDLLAVPSQTFMYRDFQSRNVMVRADGSLAFIDFQGGRRGPYYYDVASFVWQARAKYPDSLRRELVSTYKAALKQYVPDLNDEKFEQNMRLFVLFRTLQVLGAYGFRGYFEKKPDFMKNSIIPAVANLKNLIADHSFESYPHLMEVVRAMVGMRDFQADTDRELVVKVMSFAYKKGIPHDESGNGGGYVFDCRALNNPGKYDRYKKFTGLDQDVIEWLEKESTIDGFLQHAYALVDESVQRYVDRGFTNLMICFGCTGGQHRSVYSAEHTARHIHDKFGVKVELIHREIGQEQTFERVSAS